MTATPRHTAIQNVINFAIANPDDLQDLCGLTDEEIENACAYIKLATNTHERAKAVLQEILDKHTPTLEWCPENGLGNRIEALLTEMEG